VGHIWSFASGLSRPPAHTRDQHFRPFPAVLPKWASNAPFLSQLSKEMRSLGGMKGKNGRA